ncbi:hypothetical protein BH23CHL2_BH23CHL2_18600 [soil metagenome]
MRDGRWEGPIVETVPGANLPLPDSILELITARVDQLAQESRTFVQVAAIAGRVFRFGPVQRAIGWEEEPVLEALEDILARGFARQLEGPEDFAFAHHLFQEVIYAGMTGPRRTFWHRRLAEAILELQPEDVESLAHHFSRAGDNERARVYFAHSGDRARRFAALDDAARYYRAALDRWPESDPAGRAELLNKLGQCLWILGELHAALRTLDEARALYETLDDRLRLGDIERVVGRIYWEQSDRQAALEHYHRALAILEREPEGVELALAISSISQMHMMAAEFDDARAWSERALALAERLGAEQVAVHALINLGNTYASLQDYARGTAMLRDGLHRALDAGLAHDAMRAYFGLAEQHLSYGRYDEARATYDALLAYTSGMQSDVDIGIAYRSLLQLTWLTGRWDEALGHRQRLVEWGRTGSRQHIATVWANRVIAMLHNDLGQADLARRILERDLQAARAAAELQTTVPHLAELGRAYMSLGREAEAVSMFRELLDWVDRVPYLVFDCIMPLLAAPRWLVAQPTPVMLDLARGCLERLQHAAEMIETPEARMALAEASGAVLLAEGEHGRAAEQLARAADGWAALGRPYDEASALGMLARALLHAGRTSESRAARDRALALYNILAARLTDPTLGTAFLDSPQVRTLLVTLEPERHP